MRLVLAVVVGLATAVGSALVLGDYPLSGSVPWVASILIPLLIGTVLTLVAGRHHAVFWAVTGPIGALSFAWGVRIATGWGLDPVPNSCWAGGAIALAWPLAWAGVRARRAPAAPDRSRSSVHGHLGDLGDVGRSQVGDP